MRPLVISSGDPSGIGLEIVFMAWQKRVSCAIQPFFMLADPVVARARADRLGLDIPFHIMDEDSQTIHFHDALPILPLKNRQQHEPGRSLTGNAAGTIEAIERAVALVVQQKAGALVTCPIAKKSLYDAGFHYPGHTEFLAHLAQRMTGKQAKPVMMLAGPELRTVPVTVHIALRDIADTLTTALIVETARITAHDLREKFGIAEPRLAIAGLNPHAGEGGAMGHEDAAVIGPAVIALRKQGIAAAGPLAADTLFHARARQTYDAALCMYHNQALIFVKTIGFDETVNVTLGLPFIRTSPDHGTAFDIAGKGIASPDSLIAALRMAADLMRHQQDS